jgi:hypothetical protein
MRVGMAHSILLFATRVVEIMFFTGLLGCGTVVVISWISIFSDGFSDLMNRESDEDLHPEPMVRRHELSMPISATKASSGIST